MSVSECVRVGEREREGRDLVSVSVSVRKCVCKKDRDLVRFSVSARESVCV